MAFGLILAGAALAAALALAWAARTWPSTSWCWYKSAEASLATPPTPEANSRIKLEEDKPAA